MWDLPRPGLEPVSPALAGRFSTTAPPGKPPTMQFCIRFLIWIDPGEALPLACTWAKQITTWDLGALWPASWHGVTWAPLVNLWLIESYTQHVYGMNCISESCSFKHFKIWMFKLNVIPLFSQTLRICFPWPLLGVSSFLTCHLLIAHCKGNSVTALTSCPMTFCAQL